MRRYLRIESSPAKSESWGGMSIPSTYPCYLHNTQREEFKYVYAANGCQVSERDTQYYTSALLKSLHKAKIEQDKTIYVVQKKFVVTLMYHA